MDNPTILKMFERQDKSMEAMEGRLKEFIQVTSALNYQKIVGKLDPIEDDIAEIKKNDIIRNGRLEKTEDDIDCLRQETGITRWIHNHPIYGAIALLILFMGLAYGYHKLKINVPETIENTTGIVIEESNKE